MTNPYVPLLFLAGIGAAFAVFSVLVSPFAGPRRYNKAKADAYECGIEPTPHPLGGGKIPVKLGLFALVEMVLFILTVFVAYAYVWRRGGLEWD